jgi:hypothetical protein
MTTINGYFAREFAEIAAKTKSKSPRARLLRMAKQWQVIAIDQEGKS